MAKVKKLIGFEPDQISRLQAVARRDGVTVTAAVNEAVEDYLRIREAGIEELAQRIARRNAELNTMLSNT